MMLLVEAALHSFALGAAACIGLKAFRAENPHVEMETDLGRLAGDADPSTVDDGAVAGLAPSSADG
jgi:hypothetical protein